MCCLSSSLIFVPCTGFEPVTLPWKGNGLDPLPNRANCGSSRNRTYPSDRLRFYRPWWLKPISTLLPSALSENYDISTPSLTVMCSASELRKLLCRDCRIRTYDLMVPNHAFYRTELFPVRSLTWNRTTNSCLEGDCYIHLTMSPNADRTRLELATSAVTGQHSNQLNYRSLFEPSDGIEPPTYWLQISCSTSWANQAI